MWIPIHVIYLDILERLPRIGVTRHKTIIIMCLLFKHMYMLYGKVAGITHSPFSLLKIVIQRVELWASQIRTVPSAEQEARRFRLDEYARSHTESSCPNNTALSTPWSVIYLRKKYTKKIKKYLAQLMELLCLGKD